MAITTLLAYWIDQKAKAAAKSRFDTGSLSRRVLGALRGDS